MNIQDVKRTLTAAGVSENAYSFYYHRSDEQYLLYREHDGTWVVSFMERGSEAVREEFADEHSACARFLERIMSDRGVPKQGPAGGED